MNNRFTTSTFSFALEPSGDSCLMFQLPHHSSFAEFRSARETIDRSAEMQVNWDGFGGLPVSPETRQNALNALNNLERHTSAPCVIHNPNGTISFEWETGRGIGHLEVGRTRFSFYIRPAAGKPLLLDGVATQVYGLGPIVAESLYPTPSAPAYNKVLTADNV
jgi:hypothetical protein